MSPYKALKHLVYFEALAEVDEASPQWNAVTAGLVVLRMLDSWFEDGPGEMLRNTRAVSNIRLAIEAIDPGNPVRNILLGLFEAVKEAKHPDMSRIMPRLMAYGRALHYEGHWSLSSDVYETVLGFVDVDRDADIAVDAYMQMGYCSRRMARWEDAALAYAEAGQIASRSGDIERVLRARIADAKLAIDRGHLDKAAVLLDDTIAVSSASEDLKEIAGLALHERAAVAFMRGSFEESVEFAWQSLTLIKNLTARDRILSDLATSFMQLGMFEPARDALSIVAMTAQELHLRWVAEINLIEIAADMGDANTFGLYRRGLEEVEMPASLEANYHLHVGRAFWRFGESESARRCLEKAAFVASSHNFSQLVLEAEESLRNIERSVMPPIMARANVSPAVEEIAGAVHQMYLET